MKVVKVNIESPVCSFRYPHFLVGQQLTFGMPPPSTIFGHVASAIGFWPERDSFRFAYWFSAKGQGNDLEKQHIEAPKGGKFRSGGEDFPVCVEASIQPVKREFVFGIRMTLYLDRTDWTDHFLCPQFPVVLGRSQDLAAYTEVREIELQRADRGYFENTLLPFEFRRRTVKGLSVLMPCFIDAPPMRNTEFDRYIELNEYVFFGACDNLELGNRQMIDDGDTLDVWIDPESPERRGAKRALAFHSFAHRNRIS